MIWGLPLYLRAMSVTMYVRDLGHISCSACEIDTFNVFLLEFFFCKVINYLVCSLKSGISYLRHLFLSWVFFRTAATTLLGHSLHQLHGRGHAKQSCPPSFRQLLLLILEHEVSFIRASWIPIIRAITGLPSPFRAFHVIPCWRTFLRRNGKIP